MQLRRLLPLGLLMALAACGPKTVISSLFPLRYAATTVVDFHDRGMASRQTVVSKCKVVDQTDSIALGYLTPITGERHWLRRADGSLWVLGLLSPCRWRTARPDGEPSLPVRTE